MALYRELKSDGDASDQGPGHTFGPWLQRRLAGKSWHPSLLSGELPNYKKWDQKMLVATHITISITCTSHHSETCFCSVWVTRS